MAQEWAKSFYKTAKWIKCRKGYIANRLLIDGGLCEECKKESGYILHHKTLLTPNNIDNPEISLNWDNLEYVCKDCHDMFDGHGLNKAADLLVRFDSNGQPISLRDIDKEEHND